MSDDKKIRTPDYDPENPRCDEGQLKFLKDCIAEGVVGINKWNQWRMENKDTKIWLQKVDLNESRLEGINLSEAHIEGTNIIKAHLEEANFFEVHLEDTKLYGAHLEGAGLGRAHLEGAKLWEAHLEGARLVDANLNNADFSRAIVDGETLVWSCDIDRDTKLEAVGLNSMRIYPDTKQLLEYNIRRKNWEIWYVYKDWDKMIPENKRKRFSRVSRQPVKWFWAISDYGRSTGRIIFTFLGLALLFANIYYHWGRLAPPGIVENLFVDRNGVDIQWWLVPLRTLYFSIVTQTTLGFGDMYANAHSIWGHILLSFQVILGYVLLGALVTRFAVLFTAGGPAGKFAEKSQ
jgi:hypothetical protein